MSEEVITHSNRHEGKDIKSPGRSSMLHANPVNNTFIHNNYNVMAAEGF